MDCCRGERGDQVRSLEGAHSYGRANKMITFSDGFLKACRASLVYIAAPLYSLSWKGLHHFRPARTIRFYLVIINCRPKFSASAARYTRYTQRGAACIRGHQRKNQISPEGVGSARVVKRGRFRFGREEIRGHPPTTAISPLLSFRLCWHRFGIFFTSDSRRFAYLGTRQLSVHDRIYKSAGHARGAIFMIRSTRRQCRRSSRTRHP